MFVETVGQGPALVMLHGWSMNSAVWHRLREQLCQQYSLYLVDLPGHGRSDWQPGDFDLNNILDTLAAQLPEQAYWLGWSLGGLLSIAFADRFPDRVLKLSLVAATPRFVQDYDWQCAMPRSVFENFAGSLDENQSQTLQRFLMLQARGAEQSRETIRQLAEDVATQNTPQSDALHAGLDLLLNLDMRSQLQALTCPVQLILGERDTLVPKTLVVALEKLKPGIRTNLMGGAGHAPFVSHPEQCQQLIEQFINE